MKGNGKKKFFSRVILPSCQCCYSNLLMMENKGKMAYNNRWDISVIMSRFINLLCCFIRKDRVGHSRQLWRKYSRHRIRAHWEYTRLLLLGTCSLLCSSYLWDRVHHGRSIMQQVTQSIIIIKRSGGLIVYYYLLTCSVEIIEPQKTCCIETYLPTKTKTARIC